MKSIVESLAPCNIEIQSEQDQQGNIKATSLFRFPESFAAFKGHFPGIPILPGIIQLASVRYVAEHAVQKQLLPIHFSKTKFRSMVKPDQELFISLNLRKKDDKYQGKFQILEANNEIVAKGNCVFSEKAVDK